MSAALASRVGGSIRRDRVSQAICGLAALAFLLRASQLLDDGPSGPVGYDDGVYFSAAGLFASGESPYEDFVLLHPPGVLVLIAPLAFLGDHLIGYLDAFTLGRWLLCAIGAVNTALVGVVARRWRGGAAAVVAAALYATFPPATEYEGLILLEPLVNLFVLVAIIRWLSPTRAEQRPSDIVLAGSLIGIAATIKLSGGSVLLACLLIGPFRRAVADRGLLVASAMTAFLAVVLPFALRGGIANLVEQAFVTQLERPSVDGDIAFGSIEGVPGRSLSLLAFLPDPDEHLPASVGALLLALGALIAIWALVRGGRDGRFLAVAWVVVVTQLLLAPKLYPLYAVLLAPINCVLIGGVVQSIYAAASARRAVVRGCVAVAVAALPVFSTATILGDGIQREPLLRDLGANLPADACVYADPPVLAVTADRLPAVADPWGELLYISEREQDPVTQSAAVLSEPAQRRVRRLFETCDYVQLSGPPQVEAMWSDVTRVAFLERFSLVSTPDHALSQLWERCSMRAAAASPCHR